jgi:hypothetical protein
MVVQQKTYFLILSQQAVSQHTASGTEKKNTKSFFGGPGYVMFLVLPTS